MMLIRAAYKCFTFLNLWPWDIHWHLDTGLAGATLTRKSVHYVKEIEILVGLFPFTLDKSQKPTF